MIASCSLTLYILGLMADEVFSRMRTRLTRITVTGKKPVCLQY